MPLQVSLTGNDKAAKDSIAIPFKDLKTNIFSRSQVNDSTTLIQKGIYGILNTFAHFPLQGILGLNRNTTQQPSSTFGIINISFSFTYSLVIDFLEKDIYTIPIPSVGNNSGIGGLSILDVFNNASKINSGNTINNPSILIPFEVLQKYGLETVNKVEISSTSDNRDFFVALFNYLVQDSEIPVRNNDIPSAIMQRGIGNWNIANLPQSYSDKNNPVSGINVDKINSGLISLMSKTINLNIQTKLDNEILDLNITNTTR